MPPSQFSSLPEDIAWQVLAPVPKCKYPLLACASKNFTYLVRSPEIHRIRSLLRKDSLYLSFVYKRDRAHSRGWFTLRRRTDDNPSEENQFVSVDLVLPHDYYLRPSIVAHGPEIFFVTGPFFLTSPSNFVVFDSRTGVVRQGPSMKVNRTYKGVGVVGRKIYVIGVTRTYKNVAESFDLMTQTWEPAPIPRGRMSLLTTATVSLDRKVCAFLLYGGYTVCYNTRDGSCESFDLPKDTTWWRAGACVMDNVLYVYYARFGLMWYDTKLRLWRVVSGLDHLKKVRSVGMAEYYGNLALLWKEHDGFSCDKKEIWCRMIALRRCEEGISGNAESARLMGSVTRGYRFDYCLSVSE